MELLVMRHGVAEAKEAFAAIGKDDSLRPLTKEGQWKVKQAAKGLRRLLPSIDAIATSPYARALRTAEILADEYSGVSLDQVAALRPESTERSFMTWLRQRDADGRVAAVGHNPHLESLVSWLLTGEAVDGRIVLRKGGACLLRFDGSPRMGKAQLIWSVTPAALNRLARG